MNVLARFCQRKYLTPIAFIIVAVILVAVDKPLVLIWGIQRGGLYALMGLPLTLILGILGILNLAHGELLMVAAYLAFFFIAEMGLDPLVAMGPGVLAMLLAGALIYKLTIKHVLKGARLNQFLLTFGLAIILAETVRLIASPRPRMYFWLPAVSSASIGDLRFGTFEFVYPIAAIILLVGLILFLTRTRTGLAALAVGQNRRGAELVGINVDRTYLWVFSLAIAVLGAVGVLFLVRHTIFPLVGGPFSLRGISLVVMAGFGNLTGVVWAGLALGLAEAFVKSFKGYAGWAEMVFFLVIIITILIRAYQRQAR